MDKYLTATFGGLTFIAGFALHCVFEDLWWNQAGYAVLAEFVTFVTIFIACAIYIENMDSKLQ